MEPELFEHQAKGFNFYTASKHFNDIRVLHGSHVNVKQNMGVCVVLGGQAILTYEEYHGEDILALIFRLCDRPDANVTRLDIACDDRGGWLNMDVIWQNAQNGGFRSRTAALSFYENRKGEQAGGRTVYFGSPASLFRVRIYDKAKQIYAPNDPLYNSHWIRFEMVFRDTYAAQVAEILAGGDLDTVGNAVAGIINGKLSFINRDNENISRCTVASWWEDFLNSAEYIDLNSKPRMEHIIDTHIGWLQHSISRILAKVIAAVGRNQFYDLVLKHGEERLTETDHAHIADYKKRYTYGFTNAGGEVTPFDAGGEGGG
jgi:DNA relaxase NicK